MENEARKRIITLVLTVAVTIGGVLLYRQYNSRDLSKEFRDEEAERLVDLEYTYKAKGYVYKDVVDRVRENDASLMRVFGTNAGTETLPRYEEFNKRLRAYNKPFTTKEQVLTDIGYNVEKIISEIDTLKSGIMREDDPIVTVGPEHIYLDADTVYDTSLTSDGYLMVVVTHNSYFAVDTGVLFFNLEGTEVPRKTVLNEAQEALDFEYNIKPEVLRVTQPDGTLKDLLLATTKSEVEEITKSAEIELEDYLNFDGINYLDLPGMVATIETDLVGIGLTGEEADTSLNQSAIYNKDTVDSMKVLKLSHDYRGIDSGSLYTYNIVALLESGGEKAEALIQVKLFGSRVTEYSVRLMKGSLR